jgi:hypothetical protein
VNKSPAMIRLRTVGFGLACLSLFYSGMAIGQNDPNPLMFLPPLYKTGVTVSCPGCGGGGGSAIYTSSGTQANVLAPVLDVTASGLGTLQLGSAGSLVAGTYSVPATPIFGGWTTANTGIAGQSTQYGSSTWQLSGWNVNASDYLVPSGSGDITYTAGGTANGLFSITFATFEQTNQYWLFRVQDSTDYLSFDPYGGTFSGTGLGTLCAFGSLTISNGDTLSVLASGTNFTFYQNGTPLTPSSGTCSTSSFETATGMGFYTGANLTTQISNFYEYSGLPGSAYDIDIKGATVEIQNGLVVSSSLSVAGSSTLSGTAAIGGNSTISGTLGVTGDISGKTMVATSGFSVATGGIGSTSQGYWLPSTGIVFNGGSAPTSTTYGVSEDGSEMVENVPSGKNFLFTIGGVSGVEINNNGNVLLKESGGGYFFQNTNQSIIDNSGITFAMPSSADNYIFKVSGGNDLLKISGGGGISATSGIVSSSGLFSAGSTHTVLSGASCVCVDQTTPASMSACSVSGTTLTLTSITSSDHFAYICIGVSP